MVCLLYIQHNRAQEPLMKIQNLAPILLVIGLFIFVPGASAHRPAPEGEGEITRIPNPTTSYAYYRQITLTEPVHVYRFDADAGQFFHAGINIPQIPGLEDYGVSLALLGPGLPALDHSSHTDHGHDHEGHPNQDHGQDENPVNVATTSPIATPLSLMDASVPGELDLQNLGGVVKKSLRTEDFYEPFTQTSYWGRQEIELNLPETGTYYLIVWNPDGEAGKYVLDTGTAEVFGPADLLRFPIWWLSTRVYFEQTPYLLGASAMLVIGAFGLLLFRVRG
jgi:hypothetical protein